MKASWCQVRKTFGRCVCKLAVLTVSFDLAPHTPNLDAIVTRSLVTTARGIEWTLDLVYIYPNGDQKRHRTSQARLSTKFSASSMKFLYWGELSTSCTHQLYPRSKSCFVILASRSTKKVFEKSRALYIKFPHWGELSTS